MSLVTTRDLDDIEQEFIAFAGSLFIFEPAFVLLIYQRILEAQQEAEEREGDIEGALISAAVVAAIVYQAQQQMTAHVVPVAEWISQAQREASAIAEVRAMATIGGDAQPPPRIPDTGRLRNGQRIEDYLRTSIGDQAAEQVRKLLQRGVRMGLNPMKVAQEIAATVQDMSLQRARLVARTVMIDHYREVTHETMQVNQRLLRGWRWSARLDRRTCVSCLVMHGTLHPIDEPMYSHAACRCRQVPVTLNAREWQTGIEWINKQSAASQRKILGAKYGPWKRGEFDLTDFTVTGRDPAWGRWRREPSLRYLRSHSS